MKKRALKIGVLGPHKCTPEQMEQGRLVGNRLAEEGCILVCGGLDGMMTAAARGAKEAGGQTIGILPDDSADEANEFIDIAQTTGMGIYRNALIAKVCDAVIAIGGHYGPLSEIAFALRAGRRVVALGSWKIRRGDEPDAGILEASTPDEAVALALGRGK